MRATKPIGILGGTFDPVHFGHLRLALELLQQLELQEVRFIPCHQPVLDKTALARPDQRLEMLKLAVADQSSFIIDERELHRASPSYMVETLTSLREEYGKTPLALIMGQDAFASLPRWHRWEELITLSHIIVIGRPGFITPHPSALPVFAQENMVQDAKELQKSSAGHIFFPKITPLSISSTAIRQQLSLGINPRYLLPDAVLEYIQREKLYCG